MRMWVWSLASLSGLGIQHCHELWCRSQTQLGSDVAVAEAGSCRSVLTPSLGTSICQRCGPKKQKKKKKKKKKKVGKGEEVESRTPPLSLCLNLPWCLWVYIYDWWFLPDKSMNSMKPQTRSVLLTFISTALAVCLVHGRQPINTICMIE